MTNNTQGTSAPAVFSFESNAIRTYADEHSELWFCASDVCNILGYQNSRLTIQKHCKEKGVSKRYTPTESGNQEMTFINEPNLYRLIIKSRKPEAERFETWLMEEVLPTIRKTGRYQMPNSPTISPAQQRALQDAIAARFPEGKQRPYAWSRFNAHYQLGSYKQLPADQCDEALAYIAAMNGGNPPATEAEDSVQQQLQTARFVLSFDSNGRMQLQEIATDAIVTTATDMAKLIEQPGGPIRRNQITDIIQAAAKRLK